MQMLTLNGSGAPLKPAPATATSPSPAGMPGGSGGVRLPRSTRPGGGLPPASAGTLPSSELKRLRALAHSAVGLGRLADARVVLEGLLVQAPADVELLGDLAALSLREGDPGAALRLTARALEQAPDHLSCRFTQAFAWIAAGDSAAARQALQALSCGALGEAMRLEQPALSTLVAAERVRLEGDPASTTGAPVHTLPLAARFDLLVKLLYVLHRRQLLPGWVTVAVPSLYARHILLRGGGAENGDPTRKPTLAACTAPFNALIDGVIADGFDHAQPVQLSQTDGLPVEGAHRLAIALALGLPAALQQVDAPGHRWDLPWFQQHGFEPEACNVLLRTWARLRGDAACVSLLWSPAEAQWPELEAALSREMVFVGARTLELPREGFEELVRDVHAADTGPRSAPAIESKVALLRAFPPRVRVVYTERRPATDAASIQAIETALRDSVDAVVPAAWLVTLHMSATAAESRHVLDIVASELNLAMLRRRRALPAAFVERLAALHEALAAHAVPADDACIVGGGVLAALGLRPSEELDLTLRRESRHARFDAGTSALAPGVELVPEGYACSFAATPAPTDDELIASPYLHFRVRGLRFAAAHAVRTHQQHQRRDADLRDLSLLADFDEPRGS